MATPIITFSQAGKEYTSGSWALEPLSVDLYAGEFISVVGSSGGGKTTLLKMINGLLLPTVGTVSVDGEITSDTDLIALRRRIGYVIQGAALFPHLTVAENISYVPSLTGDKLSSDALAHLMELVDLPTDLLQRYPIRLSGGQQQRVGIARALATQPNIMLMDEPFGAVDEITRSVLQENIHTIHQQLHTTIVFVTHNMREALKLSDRIMVLHQGKLEQLDTPERIQQSPASDYVAKLLQI